MAGAERILGQGVEVEREAGGKMIPDSCPAVVPGLYLAHGEALETHSDHIWSPETIGGGIGRPYRLGRPF